MPILIIAIFYLINSISSLSAQNNFEEKPCWKETFNNIENLDTAYWSYILGMRGKESEYYTNNTENVHIKKGKLIIKALNEKRNQVLCTSGRIHTQGKDLIFIWKTGNKS